MVARLFQTGVRLQPRHHLYKGAAASCRGEATTRNNAVSTDGGQTVPDHLVTLARICTWIILWGWSAGLELSGHKNFGAKPSSLLTLQRTGK